MSVAKMVCVTRLIWPNERHITRFHTQRGTLMPLSGWLRTVPALLTRIAKPSKPTPWIVPAAVDFLARNITSDWHIFEFGSGFSTIWLSQRAGRVVSIEHNEQWFRHVREQITRRKLTNCELSLVPLDRFAEQFGRREDQSFDLIYVDADEREEGERLAHVAVAVSKLKHGGYLLLDDSDRPGYRQADEMLKGWPRVRFVGVKPYPFVATETSIYRRPQRPMRRKGEAPRF
jgi:predicted O-methyltransferase YrrM